MSSPLGQAAWARCNRARDTKLGRDVALKALPEDFTKDPERQERFEREAKVLAALNHASIATLYGFEDGALVMKLVEGETLAERLERGPIRSRKRYRCSCGSRKVSRPRTPSIVHRDLNRVVTG